jgi:predicted  nucleic acid-binding Zn-ribbon protein
MVPQTGGATVLDSGMLELFKAQITAVGSAETLILQPPFTNNLLPTLPEDQALAAQHAGTFKAGWGFGVVSAFVSGLQSISHFVTVLTNSALVSVADRLDKLDPHSTDYPQALSDFRALVAAIVSTCCDADENSGSTLSQMKNLLDKLTMLSGNIADDDTRLQTAITEVQNSATIEKLEAQQQDLQDQFAAVNAEIAKGATTTIASDLAFGFEFGSAFLEGVTTGAVVGAALSVVGEVAAVQQFDEQQKAFSAQQASLSDQISALADTIAEDKTDAMTLTLTAAQVAVFDAQVQSITGIAGGIVDQMIGWGKQLDDLAAFSSPPVAGFYASQIASGNTFWSALHAQVTRYAQIMSFAASPEA